MRLNDYKYKTEDYKRVEQAIRFIEANFKSQPSLEEIAESVYLSRFHFDRLFKRWAGISPMQFVQFLTLGYAKQKLRESRSLLETSLESGLSGPGRLHDLFVTFEAMTPGEYKKQAVGLKISYGFSCCPFGECLLAVTGRGICYFGFVEGEKRSEVLEQLFNTWPGAVFAENNKTVRPVIKSIFNINGIEDSKPFNLCLKGSNFQINVWKALLTIPEGCVLSYQDIASYIGNPKAYRAVGSAVAANPVAYLIPCHRVIAKSGKIREYRWGSTRKKALIGWEAARLEHKPA